MVPAPLTAPRLRTGAFAAARAILEKLVRDQPDNASAWSLLGRVQAALGQKEEAQGRSARPRTLPLSRGPTSGLAPLLDLAKIYGWAGENDQALQQLATHGGGIGCFSYGELRLDPDWDSPRGDPRFEKMLPPSRQARTNSCHPERDRQSGSDRGTG